MHRTTLLAIALSFTLCSLACSITSGDQSFTISGWKAASKDERRRMTKDFLKKYDTKGITVAQIKELLGDPDYEHDTWSYNLSLKGAPPPGPQTIKVFLEYPQLYVSFREGRVDSLSETYGLQLKDEIKFDVKLWQAGKPPERLKMITNLKENDILRGRNKDEVQQLLGSPDGQSERHEIEYDLGTRMIDTVTLTFTLNTDGTVSDAQVIEH